MVPPAQAETDYRKLTSRNTLLTIILFVSPFILLYFAVNYEVSSLIKNQIYNRLAATVEENVKTIDIFLRDRQTDLQSFSHLDIQKIDEVRSLSPFLESLLREKKWYDFLLLADLQGNIVLSINRQISGSIADREYFQASRAGRFFNSGIFASDMLKSTVMILSHPVIGRRNEVIGVLAASVDLKSFYSLLFDLRIGKTSELFLTDARGTLLSPTKLGGRPLIDAGYFAPDPNPHRGDRGVTTHIDYRGQRVLCAYMRLPGSGDYIVSEMDLKEALLPLRQVSRIVLYLFVPFLVVLVVISNLYARRTTSLLRRLTMNLRQALGEAQTKRKEVDSMNVELEKRARESERLAQELRLSGEYITSLVDSISLGVIGLDPAGVITHSNRRAPRLLGVAELKRGENVFAALRWFSEKDIEAAFEDTIMAGRPHRLERRKVALSQGEEYFNLSFFPVEDDRGRIQGVSALIEDITEREKLHHQLAEYEKLSSLSQLALGAAHEINNPLLGISSYLEILRDDAPDEAARQEIGLVLENVYRISETIRGLLNFARPSPPQFTRVNINELIEETLSFLGHQPIFRNIKITRVLPAALPAVTADLNQVRQVLTNLFINAAQAMPQGGELTAETSKVKFQETLRIDITDTGVGIPPENLTKIFDPFFTTKKSLGTGLGLSISLSYVKSHSGDILVESRLGQGTRFSILLPIRQLGKAAAKDEDLVG
jgi:PAS domain S-box-containing protein